MIYLNYSDGRKPKLLNGLTVRNPQKNFDELNSLLKKVLHLQRSNFLSYSQNLTTSLIFSLQPILEKNLEYSIYISTHEIKWFKTLFDIGELPIRETTYPNYVKQKSVPFLKKEVHFFDPETELEHIEKITNSKPVVIILSHVSRITGQKFVTESLYKKIKKMHPQNILIVDGSQSVGAMQVFPEKVSDVYLGVTSKFINAEPHIGFCYVSSFLQKKYQIDNWTLDPISYSREIYSALFNIKKLVFDSKKIKAKQLLLEHSLKERGLVISRAKNQVPYITIILWQGNLEEVVNQISKRNIAVFHNQKYSILEPKKSGIRVSFTTQTKDSEIKKLVSILGQIKKSRT